MEKRRVIKTALALSLALGLGFAYSGTAHAISGWTNETGEWQYLDRDDMPIKNGWKQSKGYWYYLSSEGTILKSRIFKWGGGTFYVDGDGKMLKNSWLEVTPDMDPDGNYQPGWYYFGSDGRAYVNQGGGFKRKVDGKDYAFDENGKMLTGFIDKTGNVIETEDPFVGAMYYASDDGALYNNKWLNYGYISDTTGVGGSNIQSTVTGRSYSDYGSMWMYFDSEGKKFATDTDTIKEKTIGGELYAFDEYGIMVPWWSKASVSNAQPANPTMENDVKYFSGYDGGKMLKNKWIWMYPSEIMDQKDFIDQESSWFYADSKGNILKNTIRTINGKKYAFDGLGRMQTGFVVFNNTDVQFVARYDMDAFTSEQFANGDIYGGNKNDLYLFSPNKLNDGSMQTGELQIELADGVRTFGFSPTTGKAYGSKDILGKKTNRYYINGLRLDADEDYGYGVVAVTEEVAYSPRILFYQVVDTSGRIVKGNKKVVKDKEGAYFIIMDNKLAAYESRYTPKWHTKNGVTGYYQYDSDSKKYLDLIVAAPTNSPDLSAIPTKEILYRP